MDRKWEFKLDKECKHSRRYASIKDVPEKCPIDTIYVKREFADGKDYLYLTISEE